MTSPRVNARGSAKLLAILAIAAWSGPAPSSSAAALSAAAADPEPSSATTIDDQVAVTALLREFEVTYDNKQLEGFVAIYVDKAEPTYIFEHELIRGRAALEDDYRRRFFSTSEQQTLRLELVSLRRLGGDYLMAVTRADLRDAEGNQLFAGISTLILQREKGRWRVLHDHSS